MCISLRDVGVNRYESKMTIDKTLAMNNTSTTNPGEGKDEIPKDRPSQGYDLLQQQASAWQERIERYHSVLGFIARGLLEQEKETTEEQLNQQAVKIVNEFLLDLQLGLLDGKIDENQLNTQFLATQLKTYIKNK